MCLQSLHCAYDIFNYHLNFEIIHMNNINNKQTNSIIYDYH